MKDIEELRGLAVIEGKDLATYEYELLKDLYEENQEQQRVLDKTKEYIKENSKNISITPNSVKAVPVEYILELLEEIE